MVDATIYYSSAAHVNTLSMLYLARESGGHTLTLTHSKNFIYFFCILRLNLVIILTEAY